MSAGPNPGADRPAHVADTARLSKRLVDREGYVGRVQWNRAEGEFVGQCRQCGGNLVTEHAQFVNERRTDFEARCVQCKHIVVAPFGKTYPDSGRKSERRTVRPWEKSRGQQDIDI